MCERLIDNRGLAETDLYAKISVDPWDLVRNAIENAPLSEESADRFVLMLEALYEQVDKAVEVYLDSLEERT